MLDTYPQIILALIFLGIGIGIGVVIGTMKLLSILCNNNAFVKGILDCLACIVTTITYLYLVNAVNWGEHRLFIILAYIVGIFIERKTLGKLFAKLYYKLYTIIAIRINKLSKTKLGTFVRR